MEFTVIKSEIDAPLKALCAVAMRGKTSTPILTHLLVDADPGGQVRITAANHETQLQERFNAQVLRSGRVTIPAAKLRDICASIDDDSTPLRFRLDDTKVLLRVGKSRFTVQTLPADSFPNVEVDDYRLVREIEAGELHDVLARVNPGIANNDMRHYLNGALFEFRSETLTVVGSDGHRLHLDRAACGGIESAAYSLPGALTQSNLAHAEGQCIISRDCVAALMRQLRGCGDSRRVVIALAETHFEILAGGSRLVTKIIEGEYPNYERIIPGANDAQHRIEFERDAMKAALQRIRILANEKYHGGKLTFEHNRVKVESSNANMEDAQEDLEVNYQGESLTMGFNVNYLLDVLSVIDTPTVTLSTADANHAALLQPEGRHESSFVVMPMRL